MAEEQKQKETQNPDTNECASDVKETSENTDSAYTAKEQNSGDSKDAAKEEAPEEPTLEEQLESLKKENADLKDQLLRRAADFDNYRKRTIKEKQDAYDYANTALLQDLLESLDNFDRTVEAAEKANDAKSIADGVKMINSSLIKMLETKYNLASFGAAGEDFNPDIHEAIGRAEGDVEKPVLQAVFLKGYKLKDRVIRNAKVMVTMPKETK